MPAGRRRLLLRRVHHPSFPCAAACEIRARIQVGLSPAKLFRRILLMSQLRRSAWAACSSCSGASLLRFFVLCCATASDCVSASAFAFASASLMTPPPPFLTLRASAFSGLPQIATPPYSHLKNNSFSILIGPLAHLKHLVSAERLPFSAVYFGSLGLTLYFALGPQSYFGSLVGGIVQVCIAFFFLGWVFFALTLALMWLMWFLWFLSR